MTICNCHPYHDGLGYCEKNDVLDVQVCTLSASPPTSTANLVDKDLRCNQHWQITTQSSDTVFIQLFYFLCTCILVLV